MAFPDIPTVAGSRILFQTNTAGGATKTFPSLSSLTKNAGDLLIAICIEYDGNSTNAEFSAWGGSFLEFGDFAGTATMAIGCAYKISTGSETGTFTVTTADTSANDSVMILMSIPGANQATAPEAGGFATGTNAAINPGSLNPAGWDTEDTLWIAVGGLGEDATTGTFTTISAAPTNYTGLAVSSVTADVVGGVFGGVAFRQLNGASDDPGTFTNDTSNVRWGGLTIAVRPQLLRTLTDTGSTITGDTIVSLANRIRTLTDTGLTQTDALLKTVPPVILSDTGATLTESLQRALIRPAFDNVTGRFALVKSNGGVSPPNNSVGVAHYGDYLYVTDLSIAKFYKFDEKTLTLLLTAGTTGGTGDDQVNTPRGVCADATYIYIVDASNNRIKKHLASDLSYVSKIGTSGTGDDQFAAPSGMCYDGTHLYICDQNNNRIQKRLASDLSYVAKIGTVGSGDDQFTSPIGISTDGTHLYIADFSNNRIVKRLCSDLSYVSQTATIVANPTVCGTAGGFVYYATSGNPPDLYVLNASDLSYSQTVYDFKIGAGLGVNGLLAEQDFIYTVGSASLTKRNNLISDSLSFAKNTDFIVLSDTGTTITDSFTKFVTKNLIDYGMGAWAQDAFIGGTTGNGGDQFNTPTGITFVGDYVLITDSSNNRIKKHRASDLAYIGHFGSSGSGDNQFTLPRGICNDGTHFYVADQNNDRIKKHLLSDLSYVAKLGTVGTGNNNFNTPVGICTDGTHLYVVDQNNNRIKKHLCSDLSYVAEIGTSGSGDNQFSVPSTIATDGTHLYIVDDVNNRVKKHLCSDLSYVAQTPFVNANSDHIAVNGGIVYYGPSASNRSRDVTLLNASDLSSAGTLTDVTKSFVRGFYISDSVVYHTGAPFAAKYNGPGFVSDSLSATKAKQAVLSDTPITHTDNLALDRTVSSVVQRFRTISDTGVTNTDSLEALHAVGGIDVDLTDTGVTNTDSLVKTQWLHFELSDDGLFSTFPQTPILDDFSGSLSGWTNSQFGDGALTISSGQVMSPGSGQWGGGLWTASPLSADQEVYCTVAVAATNYLVIWVRCTTNGAGSNSTGYLLIFQGGNWSVIAANAGDLSNVIASGTQSLANGDKIGLSAIGSTLTVLHKPSAGSWTVLDDLTDTNVTQIGSLGLEVEDTTLRIDDFGGGVATDSLVSSAGRFRTLSDTGSTITESLKRTNLNRSLTDLGVALVEASWRLRTTVFGTTGINGIARSENDDMWVAVADSGKLATSTDRGITWTLQTSSFSSTNINAVARSDSEDLWVAVGDTGKLATSSDGTTWTQQTSGFSTTGILDVAYSASEDLWIAVGNSGKYSTSPDGTTWTAQTPLFSGDTIQGIARSDTADMWVAVGSNGNLSTSDNGTSWQPQSSSFSTNIIYSIAYSERLGMWVATGQAGNIASSFDGAIWTSRTSGFGSSAVFDVAYSETNRVWAIVGSGGKLSTSVDGISWTLRASPDFSTTQINGIEYSPARDTWIIVGSTGKISGTLAETLVSKRTRPLTDTGSTVTESLATRRARAITDTGFTFSETLTSYKTSTRSLTDSGMYCTPQNAVLEPFTGTGALSGSWTAPAYTGDSVPERLTDMCVTASGTYGSALYNAVSYGVDQESYCTVPSAASGQSATILWTKIKNPNTGTACYYTALFSFDGDVLYVIRGYNASETELVSGEALTLTPGDKVGMKTNVVGADIVITVWVDSGSGWTLRRSVTDTGAVASYPLLASTGGNIGFAFYGDGLSVTRSIDDFGGGSIVTDSLVALLTPGGSGSYSWPISDTGVTNTDSLVKLATLSRTLSDTGVTNTDSLLTRREHVLTDTGLTQTDSLVKLTSNIRAISDTGSTITESLATRRNHLLTDTGLTQTDSLVKTQWLHFAITDTGVTNTDTIVDLRLRALSDNGSTVTDSLVATRRLSVTLSDTAITHTDELIKGRYIFISDTGVTSSDTLVAQRRLSLTLSDTGVTNTDSLVSNRNRPLTTTGTTNTDSLRSLRNHVLTDTGVSLTDVLGPRIYHNLTDTGTTVSDTLVRLLIATRSISDTGVTNTDSLVIYRVRPKTLTDTGVTPGDTLVSLRQFYRVNTDTGLTQTDSLVKLARITRSATDTGVTQTDSLTTSRSRTLTDPGTTNTDSLATRRNHVLTDTALTQTDSVNVSSGLNIGISDTGITQTDSLAARRSFSRTLTDTAVTHSDTLASNRNRILVTTGNLYSDSLTTVRRRYLSDTGVSLTDVLAERIYHNLTDTGVTNTDSLVRRLIATRSISDTGVTQTDNLSVSTSGSIQISDTGLTQTDSLVATRRFLRTLSTTGETQTDSLVTYRRVSISLTDTGVSLTDVLAERIYHNCTDTGVTQTDTLVATRRFFKSLTDTGNSHTDLLVSSAESSENLTDTGLTHNDSLALRVGRYISDTGIAQTDSLSPTRELHITLSDQGLTQTDTLVAFRFTEAFKIIAEEPYRRYYATMTTHYESQLSYSHWSQMKLNVFKAYYVREWYRRWKS